MNPVLNKIILFRLASQGADRKQGIGDPAKPAPSDAGGYTLPLAVVIGFMLLLGGLALASRSNWSIFGNAFQGQAWNAKDAAEIGMNVIVNQLNQPRNRWLNVVRNGDPDYAADPVNSTTADTWVNRNSSEKVLELRMNPCLTGKTSTPSSELPFYGDSNGGLDPAGATSQTYQKWYVTSNGQITSTQGTANRSFRLVKVIRQPYAGNVVRATNDINGDGTIDERDQYLAVWRDRADSPSGVGKVIIQVEGQSYQSGRVVSSIILEKEFELTPKCCGLPFGGSHGNVDYLVKDSGSLKGTSACLAGMLGLGILGGSSGTNTGSITIRGNATDIEDPTEKPINPIYCLASNKAGCAVNVNASSINVAVVDTSLPKAYTYASPRPGVTLPANRNMTPGQIMSCSRQGNSSSCPTNATSSITDSSSQFTYCVNSSNGQLSSSSCNDTTVINGGATTYPSFCSVSSDDKEMHCNVTSLQYSSNMLFLTGSRKLTLYFGQAGTVIAQAGNNDLIHCSRITAGLPTGCSQTRVNGDALQVTDLTFFGSNTALSPQQAIQLQGNANLTLKFFMYFPTGSVTLIGNSKFEGILWTDDITSTGNPTWVVPGSGLASVFGLMGMTGGGGGQDADKKIQPLLYDFVLRSTDRYRWIGA